MSHLPLCEYLGWGDQHIKVDAQAGVIHGVKVLGLTSRNGRRYSEQALQQAVPLYEGAKVNINHPKGDAAAPRDYRDRLGFLCAVCYREGEGLFADLHFNPKHDVAERLIWDAEHAPQNVGLSHNVLAHIEHRGETPVVTEIHRVLSVDLVADPATTSGLFESLTPSPQPQAEGTGGAREPDNELKELARLRRELALRRHIREWNLLPPDESPDEDKPALGPLLWEMLLAQPDDSQRRRLLAELAELIRTAKQRERHNHRPTSRDPLAGNDCANAAAFVEAITRRRV
ncbi:MAG: hypothetical protein ACUVQG_03845 [Thermogutta sp.]